MSKGHNDFLTAWVQHEKKIITYRLLSRELKIHVDDAKQAIKEFYDANRTDDSKRPHATFILIGELKPEPTSAQQATKDEDVQMRSEESETQDSTYTVNGAAQDGYLADKVQGRQSSSDALKRGILLASEAKLEDTKAKFSSITSCHIYSLQPGPLKDAVVLSNVQHELHSTPKYADVWAQTGRGKGLGVILNESIKDNYDPTKSLPSLAGPSTPALAPSADTKKPSVKPEAKTTTAKKEESKTTGGAAAKKGGLDWSRAKPKDHGTKRKNDSDADDNDEHVVAKDWRAKATNTRAALFGDDEESSDEDDGKLGYDIEETPKRAGANKKTDDEAARQKKALEDMMEVDDDPDIPAAADTSTSMMQGSEKEADTEADTKPKRRVRKQRKIQRKTRRKDERGYMVTEYVDEYESYSSDESDAPAPTKSGIKAKTSSAATSKASTPRQNASPAPSSAATAKKEASSGPLKKTPSSGGTAPKKGQQSLASFFTKKPKS